MSPDSLTAGASGAVFGLMGATVVAMRSRGIDPMRSGIGGLLLMNLFLTFLVPGVSIGGHLGGLALGGVAGQALVATEDRGAAVLGLVACAALAAMAFLGSLFVV